jgi:hypothetical protein
MSRPVSQIIEHPHNKVTRLIEQLERINGYPSHDVRLTAENIQKTRAKIVELGLDPDDTTGEELYEALKTKFLDDSRKFDEHFGVHGLSFDEKASKAIVLVSRNANLPDNWVLKTSAVKNLLRQHPPKRTMKQLNYRSLDSFLKRENLAEIYLAAEILESGNWNKKQRQLVSALDSTAFERRPMVLLALSSHKWGLINGDYEVYSNDYGVLALLPSQELKQTSLLHLVVSLLDELSEFQPLELSQLASSLSPAAAWWADSDALVANKEGEPISFNLKDVADNYNQQLTYGERSNHKGQKSFWQNLLNKYENQLQIEEDKAPHFEEALKSVGGIGQKQPAFEFVEDF